MAMHHPNILANTQRLLAASAIVASVPMVISSNAMAAQTLERVTVQQMSATSTQMRIGFQGEPIIPSAYQLDNPSRLVLDFDNTVNAMAERFRSYDVGLVEDVTTLNSDSTTRLIVGLKAEGQYSTAVHGNELILTLTDPEAETPITPITPAQQLAATPVTPVAEATMLTRQPPAVEATATAATTVRVNPLLNPNQTASALQGQYRYEAINALNYSPKGEGGTITMSLTNDALPVDIQRQGKQLIVRIIGSTIPPRLLRRLDVSGGLVSSIHSINQGQNSEIRIQMAADYEYRAFQSGKQLNIDISKPALLREPSLEDKVYSGERLSMEFQDVEIRSVLDILAHFTEMNVVASDSVAGRITLRLINVPWDQALDIIMTSKGLAKRENGNVILIAPAAELAEQEARALEAQQALQTFAPLRTEYIRLSYAQAEDIFELISQGRGSQANERYNKGSLLSDRGTVAIDERTNTLIVQDVSESIENIHALVNKIDIPVRQVMIEARIVSANDSFSKEIGVRWGILSNGVANNRHLLVGGSDQTLWDLKEFDIETTTIDGQSVSYPKYDITRPDNLNVDLGVASPAGRIAFGLLSMSDLMLDLELSAMQADNRGEVISTPKVLTADKQTAKVSSGTQIPYQEASASGATTTSFKEAALSLEATPNITPDGRIGLQLLITNGSPKQIGGVVAIQQDSISTNVIVEDGQTVVLGGVFKNQISNGVKKVPFLGDLPYIGRAFRNNKQSNEKQELLIFITPKLVNDGVSRFN